MKKKKGFISFEYVIIGALILTFAAYMFFRYIPLGVRITDNAIQTQNERFDKDQVPANIDPAVKEYTH